MLKVSIILTTYNSAGVIQKTIDSVKKQDGLNQLFRYEWLVVDDCSTDNTHEILLKNKIPFLVNKKNSGGPNKGRNIALKKATGDVICFLDHDDIWVPEKIRLQLSIIEKVPIVSTGYIILENKLKPKTILRGDVKGGIKYYKKNETFKAKLKRSYEDQKAYLSTIMIRKELKNIFFEDHFGMLDFDWLLRIFENQPSAEIQLPLMKRQVKNSNLSLSYEYRKKDYHFAMLTFENYEKQYPDEVAVGRKKINASRAKYHYLMDEMRYARRYLIKSSLNVKNIAYYLTSYLGSSFVRRNFNVFG